MSSKLVSPNLIYMIDMVARSVRDLLEGPLREMHLDSRGCMTGHQADQVTDWILIRIHNICSETGYSGEVVHAVMVSSLRATEVEVPARLPKPRLERTSLLALLERR